MLKKISLRARLTLLSAMVMASVAVMLTGMFLVGADRILYAACSSTLLPSQMNTILLYPPQSRLRQIQGK